MNSANLRERRLVVFICEVLQKAALPQNLAIADLHAAMHDADAETAFDEIMQAWGELCAGTTRETDTIALGRELWPAKHVDAADPALNDRQVTALAIARSDGRVSTADLATRFDVTTETLRQDLVALAESGRLEAHGETRGRFYTIATPGRNGGTL